jgi:magnesium-transporting ATPase (P-type)
LTTQQSSKASRLEYQIKVLVKFLSVAAFLVGLIAFVVGGINTNFNKVVTLIVMSFTVCSVAMIPEVI